MLESGFPLLDAIEAAKARDRGLAQAASHAGDFMVRGLAAISKLTGEVQGEDIRAALLEQGITPHSHQAWGSLVRAAIAQGRLIPTGHFKQTRSVKTHRHKTEVYEVAP